MKLKINPELRDLLPKLTKSERDGLEADLIAHGPKEALVVWNGTIVDGHNRYEICTRNNIPFHTVEYKFDGIEAAKEYVLRNQMSRRNLPDAIRIKLATRLERILAEKAKANSGLRTDLSTNSSKGYQPIDTRKEAAASAQVSEDTYRKGKIVLEKAPEEVKGRYERGEISTNKAYEMTVGKKEEEGDKQCPDCGQTKPANMFRPNQPKCNECFATMKRIGKAAYAKTLNVKYDHAAIIEQMKTPSEEGAGQGLDNHIVAEFLEDIKAARCRINRYCYMPSAFKESTATSPEYEEVAKAIEDMRTILSLMNGGE